jgi:hypothetical protein
VAKTVQLTFTIYLTDIDVVRTYQAAFPNGWIHGPIPAATELSAELGYTVAYQQRDDPFVAPCVRTAWHPRETSGKFFYDRAVFTISGGGFFGWLGFGDTRFVWVGQFVYSPPEDEVNTDPPEDPQGAYEWAPLPTRYWSDGLEAVSATATKGEGGSGKGLLTRDASRTPDGYGCAIRSAGNSYGHNFTDFGGSAPAEHWQRVYLRLRRAPSTLVPFWDVKMTGGSGAEGLRFYITTSGQIAGYSVDNSSVETFQGTLATLPLNTWVKLDAFFHSYIAVIPPSTNALFASVNAYLDGVASGSVFGPVRTPQSTVFNWITANLANTGSGHSLELDIDDWIGSDCPERFKRGIASWEEILGLGGNIILNQFIYRDQGGVRRYYRAVATQAVATFGPPDDAYWIQSLGPRDFFTGSHVLAVRPLSFGASHNAAAWPGDLRIILRQPMDGVDPGASGELQSSTSGGILEVNTDATRYGQGVAAMHLAVHGGGPSSAPFNTIGAGIAGAGPSMVSITQNGAREWRSVINQPGGATAGRTVHPLTLRLQKAASATANQVQALEILAEYLGVFDPCDIVVPDPADPDQTKPTAPRTNLGIHNAPYPNSPWASLASTPPLAGVLAKAGTYTGNNTGQDIVVTTPPHFVWIRPLTGASTGQRWWSSMLGAGHITLEGSYSLPRGLSICQEDTAYTSPGGASDPEERYLVRIAGQSGDLNATGVTYQYVILSDPGSRHTLNGALRHGSHAADDGVAVTLADPGFAATFLLAWIEFFENVRDTTSRLYGKGPGHAANESTRMDGTAAATSFNIATAGQLKAYSAVNALGNQIAYALFRTAEPNDEHPTDIVYQIVNYVGNGTSPRTITLTPAAGGRRPLFAIVVPDNAAAVYRDPSFSGGASRTVTGTTDITTGITAGGVDQITVGSTLNANGVDYSVLVLVGGTVACNDGWSCNGEFVLKPPGVPGGTLYDPPPFDIPPEMPDEDIPVPPLPPIDGSPVPGPTVGSACIVTFGTG